jgi:hypothetical protein
MAKIPIPRFTVRRLMVVVAILGFVLGSSRWMRQRSMAYRKIAEYHSDMMIPFSLSERSSRNRAYHGAMVEKYLRAAGRPWFPVEPDPPNPNR